ncbi:glycosyltransferase family 2 protein [Pectobacterium aquaticum]|uniref:glycosyltransferase family 2 protein n=1 Tax=Pectobacterium aquaticum TaxID=2204145 RepID=UPI001D031DBF|nr:glycosyltransferase family 2 protein [Pectobacterium aquaticum]
MSEIFSVIMPAYNSALTLRDSIKSVLNQSFRDFVLYVVDDCSSDETENIIKSYSDARVVYIKTDKNSGVANARNQGVKAASGKYITFLDSDDIWCEKKLEKQYHCFSNGFDVVCSNYKTFFEVFDLNSGVIRRSPEYIVYSDMLKSNFIGNLTGAYNAERIGKVYQKSVGHEDYVMWLSIMRKTKVAYCIQEPLAYYRISGSSLSANKLKAMLWQWHIYRKEINLSLLSSFYFFLCYVFFSLKKRKS